eukprot:CAMPEP_0113903054 /NCGR_PEP_ID=MMETSP0780_2-20120614/22247_1 /TAXON_ID=652834 /ORGANISM="Palpitomonas bilix" /LENGTH=65 /DNA_ID=CAMNT_0000896037 /DNA_START=54 /DNA_END=251 /DNA_ORIENTATION=+ /assembly_acc=CAM_ASM_000599
MSSGEEFDFEKLVNAAGCGKAYEKAEECLQEYDRDMRMCQDELREFRSCYAEYYKRKAMEAKAGR